MRKKIITLLLIVFVHNAFSNQNNSDYLKSVRENSGLKPDAIALLDSAKKEKKLEHFDAAIAIYNQALILFNKLKDYPNMLEVFSGLSDCFKKKEEIGKCFEYANNQF